MTAETFASAWGADDLIRLPTGTNVAIPPVDAEFLKMAGLPALIQYSFGPDVLITFCRLASGLTSLVEEKTVGPPLPLNYAAYFVLGDEFFCNGAAWWCVHGSTGRVDKIDIEIQPPIEFVNSSVAQFASALLIATQWSAGMSTTIIDWSAECLRLKSKLKELDPPCMGDGRSFFWPSWLEYIAEEGPEVATFRRGSRAEGEKALRAGSW